MADVDFPEDGGSEDSWGAELIAFFARHFIMSGENGGKPAIVCNEGHIVTNENQIVVNIPGV